MKKNQFLPIGTVVQLGDQKSKVMICGRQQIQKSTGKEFDYIGCAYPNGFDGENVFLFDADQILMIYFIGYQDLDELHQRYVLFEATGEETEENEE